MPRGAVKHLHMAPIVFAAPVALDVVRQPEAQSHLASRTAPKVEARRRSQVLGVRFIVAVGICYDCARALMTSSRPRRNRSLPLAHQSPTLIVATLECKRIYRQRAQRLRAGRRLARVLVYRWTASAAAPEPEVEHRKILCRRPEIETAGQRFIQIVVRPSANLIRAPACLQAARPLLQVARLIEHLTGRVPLRVTARCIAASDQMISMCIAFGIELVIKSIARLSVVSETVVVRIVVRRGQHRRAVSTRVLPLLLAAHVPASVILVPAIAVRVVGVVGIVQSRARLARLCQRHHRPRYLVLH